MTAVDTGPYWSAAESGQLDWQAKAERVLSDAPTWTLLAIAGAVLLMLLTAAFLTFSRSSKAQERRDKEHQAAVDLAQQRNEPIPPKPLYMDTKPLLGGFAVSLNGLWHFAQDQVGLSFFFAIGFVSMFDVLEIRLFSQMFRMANADPRRRWTRSLKWLRVTAWGLVFASAVANVVHAPTPWAAPFLAIMPIGAAWVIYVPLHSALGEAELLEEQRPEGRKPGPFLLFSLVWRKLWAWVFGLFGLDVNDRADEMVRRARARDAADASYALRQALQEKERLEKVLAEGGSRSDVSQAKKRLVVLNRGLEKKIRPKAQTALEMADTYDPEQGLQLMQRMAWLTNADEVALLDYGPESTAMEKLEQLNIAANADFLTSHKRAIEAVKTAEEAEETRRKAEKAVEEAAGQLTAVKEELERIRKEAEESQKQATADREEEGKRLKALREERALLENSDATAGQLYQRTVKELEETRAQLTTLMEERGKLTHSTGELQQEVTRGREEVLRLEGVQKALEERLGTLVNERDRLTTVAADAEKEAREARENSLRLEERLSSIERQQAAGVAARAQQPGRVDARIGSGGGDTRQRVRDLLKQLSPEDRQQSQRKIAAQLKDQVGLSLDGVRNHLRAIDQEDAEAAGLPHPRTPEDTEEREFEEAER